MKVSGCDRLNNLFSLSNARNIFQLQEIEVTYCENMIEIIAEEREANIEENEAMNEIEFSHLRSLKHECLSNFIHFCSRMETTLTSVHGGFQPTIDTRAEEKTLLNKKVSKLENLNLRSINPANCSKFLNLMTFVVEGCDNLQCLFSSSMVQSFQQLKMLKITHCEMVEEVIVAEEKLSKMFIDNCPCLKMLSQDSQVQARNGKRGKEEQVELPMLKQLHIFRMASLEKIWHELLPESCAANAIQSTAAEAITQLAFPQVRFLQLTKLPKLRSFYSRIHSSEWPSLKRLQVTACDKLEIFASEYPSLK
ncbi:putative disease resistance protein [Gossypium australe]|uniref:Putative disease resistance protein n=1 Tax=Gossypium australe TaxID=47621 RepID=A0A5B6VUX5_9ROSI|nr:putative disease resistance protein [Gossypium australe]